MPEFAYTDLLPVGQDTTQYRLLTADGVRTHQALGRKFLEVDPGVLTLVAREGMRDIAHLLRPGHLRQLRSILDDPQASPNDRFVARDLLQNACIAAGGVLPMCQDTRTAIIMGKRGGGVLTDGRDEEHLARGVFDAYTELNLRYSQLAPLTMWDERNTGSNLPAQIELYAAPGAEYKFLLMAKGGGSANKSFLYQQTKAVLNEASMAAFLTEKIGSLGTAACPPYHLVIVVGGTSAEYALKTAKYASARYLDTLPVEGSPTGHGFRDPDMEQLVLEITRKIGIGAQFGGKYFCHDVRVIRLPGTAHPARSRSRSPAPPTARRWPRSPRKGCSWRSWRPTRRNTFRTWPPTTSPTTWCRSTCAGRCTRSAPNSPSTQWRPGSR